MNRTEEQFDKAIEICRDLFTRKTRDYGTAWRILRPTSITDQILIKANRIRSIEIKGVNMVGEGIREEFIAIVNYAVMGLIQLERSFSDVPDMNSKIAIEEYDKKVTAAKELMLRKNHDYGEAWRSMRISSYTDMILQKLQRTKQIENNEGVTVASEGIDANYLDMLNYAVFALIKLEFGEN
jgi:hypothetical protein